MDFRQVSQQVLSELRQVFERLDDEVPRQMTSVPSFRRGALPVTASGARA
ncbi:MAG: hypothetical protein U0521_18790 [Anaerolineae bacterium]